MFKTVLIYILIINYINAGDVKLALSANVHYAINDLIKKFNEKNPNTNIEVIIGGSGKLTAQIKHNAPYDIFMSADMQYPNYLYKHKIAITEPKIYAQGQLAYLTRKKIDLSKNINTINNKIIKKIAIANPKTAPYGKATKEALINAKLYYTNKHKFVYGESISQTVAYTRNATDIGFISLSSLYSPQMKKYRENIDWKKIDNNLYTPIKQGVVILKKGKNNPEVKAFYDFILTDEAKKIFKRFGYITS
ncbi:Molybdenum ABC transporter, periplasmic molybdenum-binding protein ModA (TC 3.A.1.8.1) [hydrothermal vent metagenome]|uniref:Molybdenum ABC transporter, periplasmic molybdenum-binding protein ModA (TC 3.A.1.8.1) n=1 Tax=hydrothermal vent metagenome TaxID=652676 RepID=A0A1W1C716_9ZZZZ